MSRKYKKKDWADIKHGVGVVMIMLILMFTLRYTVCATTATQRLLFNIPADTTDVDSSQFLMLYITGDTAVTPGPPRRDTDSAHSTVNYDTTVTYDTDSSYTALLLIYYAGVASSSPGSWGIPVNWPTNSTPGGVGFNLRMYAIDTSGTDDSLSTIPISLANSSGVVRYFKQTNSAGFADFSVSSGTWTPISTAFGYEFPAQSFAVTGTDTVDFQGYDNNIIATPTNPALANAYGYIKDASNTALKHLPVFSVRSKGRNATDSTSAFNIIAGSLVQVRTDTTGLFQFTLIRTGQFSDTTRGFYNFWAERGGEKIFELLDVYLPDTGNVNLGDTLTNR